MNAEMVNLGERLENVIMRMSSRQSDEEGQLYKNLTESKILHSLTAMTDLDGRKLK